MKRPFLLRSRALVTAGTALIAGTYGLVRLAYGLMLPDVQRSLHLSSSAAGVISAGASIAYCIAAMVGLLAVSRSPRALVVAAAATAGIGAVAMALAPGALTFALACVIASAGAGMASPALVAVVARNIQDERVGRAQAVVNSGTGTGLILAGVGALVLLPDWRVAWSASGVFVLVAGAAVLVFDRLPDGSRGGAGRERRELDQPGPRAASTDGGRRRDRAGRAGASRRTSQTFPPGAWWRRHVRLIIGAFLLGAASAAVWNSGRAVLTAAGLDRQLSVLAWVAIGVGGVAVISTARFTERAAPPTAWAVTGTVMAIATAALVVAPTVLPLVLTVRVLFGWGYTAATGALIAWTTAIDRERAASGTAMLFVVLVAGQAAGAAVAGSLVALTGYGPVFGGAAAVAVLAACAAVLVGRTRSAVPSS